MTTYMPQVDETFVYSTNNDGSEEHPKWLVIIVPNGDPRPVTVETHDYSYFYDEERTMELRVHLRTSY